jgi:hypothetical protein
VGQGRILGWIVAGSNTRVDCGRVE